MLEINARGLFGLFLRLSVGRVFGLWGLLAWIFTLFFFLFLVFMLFYESFDNLSPANWSLSETVNEFL